MNSEKVPTTTVSKTPKKYGTFPLAASGVLRCHGSHLVKSKEKNVACNET
jgi:hypothetical protein